MKTIPSLLIALRFLIAPLLLADALDGSASPWFLVGFSVAFLSDIFDGIIARRLKISTPQLRQADSWADLSLYGCIAISALHLYSPLISPFLIPLSSLLFAQLALFALNLLKYGKMPSYHGYSAKLWGITLGLAIAALFGFGQTGGFFGLAIAAGWFNTLEEILITLILPQWSHDIPSFFHALERVRTRA
ncbi:MULTISPECIES: CDP-alcohol phosphatidyltransferase family protein [Spirulina sp. CCY15215]|uniref:CDP-alcohol phosphatidyltransferase family protein n=1 Tax=Spirulina sp. CCY15215 TaxID=2767591 RepID=UPI00194F4CD6